LDIGSGQNYGVSNDAVDFLKDGLFKKTATGEFGIKVAVSDTDEANPFGLFLRRVLTGVFSTVHKARISDIGNVVTATSATEPSSDIQSAIKGNGADKVSIIGKSATAQFDITDGALVLRPGDGVSFEDGILTLDLKVPGLVRTGRDSYLKVNSNNGQVRLRLETTET
jgi:hypothetical protein